MPKLPQARRSALQPEYSFDTKLGKYRNNATGRFVITRAITFTLEQQITQSKNAMMKKTQELRAGKVTLSEWRDSMVKDIKTLHVAQYALAQGGWGKMDERDYARLGGILKNQYRYLNGFATDLQTQLIDKGAIDGRAEVRAGLYAEAGRVTYSASEKLERQEAGMGYGRRVLNQAEHCDDCIEYAERGWMPIDAVPPIGSSKCHGNCKCDIEYAETLPGDESE